jgi:hypothetical protein
MTLKKNNIFALLIFAVVIHGDYFCYPFYLTHGLCTLFLLFHTYVNLCDASLLTERVWKSNDTNSNQSSKSRGFLDHCCLQVYDVSITATKLMAS